MTDPVPCIGSRYRVYEVLGRKRVLTLNMSCQLAPRRAYPPHRW